MLVFGPYSALPQDNDFVVFNLSSLTQAIPRLPGLMVQAPQEVLMNLREDEYAFDVWYYDYIISDAQAVSSLMSILYSLYNGEKVYICISDYGSANSYIGMLNESFMKILQTRYGIKYSIINETSDLDYLEDSGCDFSTVNGVLQFDADKMDYIEHIEENNILRGGGVKY